MAVNPYTVLVGPAAGPPAQELDFISWSWSRSLDDGCTFSFEAQYDTPGVETVEELASDIWVYRGATLQQRFRIVSVEQSWDVNGSSTIAVTGACYRRMLGSRHVQSYLNYVNVSQGAIIWDLIQHTQSQTNGNLGITLGSAGPTVLRYRDYAAGKNILDAIKDLTQSQNGPSWEINGNLQLNVTTQYGYTTRTVPLQLGANLISLQRPSGAAAFANVGMVAGGAGSTISIANSATLASDARGRWEAFMSVSETATATLSEQANGLVNAGLSPSESWRLSVDPNSFLAEAEFTVGDLVPIVRPAGIVAVLSPAVLADTQILTLSISADASGSFTVDATAVTVP